MNLVYKNKKKAIIKGPIIYLEGGKCYRFDHEKPLEVPDDIAYKVLAKHPDCIEQCEKPIKKAKKKSAPKAPKNKMMDEIPEDK